MAAHSFDRYRRTSRCRKISHPDRLTAEGVRIGLEIWEKATRKDAAETELVIFRCKRCWNLHIGRKRIAPTSMDKPIKPRIEEEPPAVRQEAPSPPSALTSGRNEIEDIRYLIEEFDLG